jgi:Spy/CpxP family protein refolding chaperone
MVRMPTAGVAGILALLLALTVPAAASPPVSGAVAAPEHCPMHGSSTSGSHGDFRAAVESLDLTPAQRADLQALVEDFSARGVALRERGSAAAADAMAIEPDDPRYAAATDRAGEAAAAIASDGVRLAAELRAAIHGILTAEQRATLRARRTEERKGWDEWRERHRPAE